MVLPVSRMSMISRFYNHEKNCVLASVRTLPSRLMHERERSCRGPAGGGQDYGQS